MTRHLIAACAAAAAVSCGAGPKMHKIFIDEVRGYNEGIRWRNYDDAAMRIPIGEREDFLDEHEEVGEELRISEYEVLRVRFRDARRRARVDVEFTWFLDSEGIVRKTVTRQEWEKHGKLWFMTDEVRVRGERMPGVAEPEPEPEDEDDSEPETSDEPAGSRTSMME